MQPLIRRLLCVDDDPDTNELLNHGLGEEGYEVITVDTQAGALEFAKQEPFDLYLLDDWLPDGRGKDLITKIREFDPNTPIIFFSGNTEEANQAEIMHLGAQAFLAKPADLDEVRALIEQAISEAEHIKQKEGKNAPPQ